MRYPVDNKKITSPYGMRTLPGRNPVFHYGIDFTGSNKFALAPCDITVDRILEVDREYPCRFKLIKGKFEIDNTVPLGRAWTPYVIAHSSDSPEISFVFKHISPVKGLSVGDIILEGGKVGELGNFGFSMGSHLHFEILINGKHTNPAKWLIENVNKV